MRRLRPTGTTVAGTSWRAARPGARPDSSARSTVRSSLASDTGFSMKSKAPRRVASTAVSTVPWPDIITTGQGRRSSLVDHSRSRLMPSASGIQMSSSTRSGLTVSRWRRACAAFAAELTS